MYFLLLHSVQGLLGSSHSKDRSMTQNSSGVVQIDARGFGVQTTTPYRTPTAPHRTNEGPDFICMDEESCLQQKIKQLEIELREAITQLRVLQQRNTDALSLERKNSERIESQLTCTRLIEICRDVLGDWAVEFVSLCNDSSVRKRALWFLHNWRKTGLSDIPFQWAVFAAVHDTQQCPWIAKPGDGKFCLFFNKGLCCTYDHAAHHRCYCCGEGHPLFGDNPCSAFMRLKRELDDAKFFFCKDYKRDKRRP